MDGLSSTEGLVAIGGMATSLLALTFVAVLAFKLRRVKADQQTILGPTGDRDLVDHAARLERGFVELRDWVEDTATGIERRMALAEDRVDGCVAHRALVRYDAWGEMSGQQSSSLALLDAHRSGVIVSTIHHRDSARVYLKQVIDGRSEAELSPEEYEAVEQALAGSGASES